MDRWKIAAVGEEPWTICLQLVVPGIYIPERFTAEHLAMTRERKATIVWLPAPSIGRARLALFVRARTEAQHLSEFISGEYEILGCLDLTSGGAVWAISYEEVLPDDAYRWWQNEVASLKVPILDPINGLDGALVSSLQVAAQDHPFPSVRDSAVGRSNFRLVGDAPDAG